MSHRVYLYKVVDISWETDGESVDLPDEVLFTNRADDVAPDEEIISDFLSDKFGWLVKSFKFTKHSS